ncbi:MAG: hypothetical protein EHM87_16140 [Burkholderiales bacterium]|nr:MAG: hypothetical protein EHM87_16140 [Burkholderiales bacterium]
MPVSEEEFRSIVEKLPNGAELIEYHLGAVEREKNIGARIQREKNHENQRLRAFKKAIERTGFQGTDAEIDAYVDELMAKVDENSSKGNTQITELQKTIAKLQRDFEATRVELGTEREQKSALEKQARIKTIESKLLPKLQDEFYGANFIVKALLADGIVDLDDSGEVTFKQGENVLSFNDGIKLIGEQNSDARKNKQNGGAGSTATTQTAKPKFTLEQIKAMDQSQIQSNLADVNESMRQYAAAK